MSDRFESMFDQQREFMELLKRERNFPDFPVDLTSKTGQRVLKDISHDCVHEIFESIFLLTNSKAHRKTEVEGFRREDYIEELSDVLHFFNELCIAAGVTHEELFEAYMKKGLVNFNRIKNGY